RFIPAAVRRWKNAGITTRLPLPLVRNMSPAVGWAKRRGKPMAAPALVKLENLKKHYPRRSSWFRRSTGEVKAVDGISLELYAGEPLGVVGESGCGKSTIGRTLIRLEKPTEGRIRFEGADITHLSSRKLKPYRRK